MKIFGPFGLLWRIRQWWRWNVKTRWYKLRYGVDVDGFHGSMFPNLGRGQFVSVLWNGPYLEITAHQDYPNAPRGMIRIIPYQPNHGFMVEMVYPDGRIGNRGHCDYQALVKMIGANAESRGVGDGDEG